MAKTKTIVKPPKETKLCISCGEEKVSEGSANKFYKHNNPYLAANVGVCKACVEKVGATNDMEEIHKMLQLLDLPLLPDKWEACNAADNTLIEYVGSGKGLNNPKATIDGIRIYEMRYKDSPSYNPVEDVSKFLLASDEQKIENIAKWGEHYSMGEYMKMNLSVENNIKITGRDDYSSIKAFERVARAEVQVDRVYGDSSAKQTDVKAAEETFTATQKQAGLAYEQISKNNSESTLGTDIRDVIENYEPVPEVLEELADVDFMGEYIERFITKPLLRSVGKDNSNIIDEFKRIRDEIKARAAKWANKKSSDSD